MTFNFQIYSFLEFQLEEINNCCFNERKRKALKNEDGSNQILIYFNVLIFIYCKKYCKNRMDNNWDLYDDESVTKCNEIKEYLESKPYILLYRKK